MCKTLKLPRGRMDLSAELEAQHRREFSALVARRCQRVPLQHITGEAPFRHMTLQVGDGVFIPRPETELVAEAVIREVRRIDRRASVLDLCSGSGAIGLAIATECDSVDVTLVEVSPEALSWLEQNVVAQEGLISEKDSDVVVVHADISCAFVEWQPGKEGSYDVVVSNPPYVPSHAQIRELEVAQYDPPLALYAGSDGLSLIKAVIAIGAVALRPGGMLVIEHGDEQGLDAHESGVPYWVRKSEAFIDVHDRPDLNSRPRFTTAVRK
jgi:release factor glutamine methyltransferase